MNFNYIILSLWVLSGLGLLVMKDSNIFIITGILTLMISAIYVFIKRLKKKLECKQKPKKGENKWTHAT